MPYIKRASREQIILFPDCIEDYVSEDNPVRVIDAFVDNLCLEALGFTKSIAADTGRPAYNPSDLLKLYLYGYFYRIRSSRKLMTECSRNVELFWLLGQLKPDFRTIADFRKDNPQSLKRVFIEFVRLCDKLKLYDKELIAVDGSKFRAQNSKDKCFNAEILQKKLANIDKRISEYLQSMDHTDELEHDNVMSPEQVKKALRELRVRKDKYEGYMEELEKTDAKQILETDPEARRMHSSNGFHCCYNVQTAIDSGNHLIVDYIVTNHGTDQGLLNEVCELSKKTLAVETIETIADKGYESREDILKCLMNGTIPNVALKYDKDERVFNLQYEHSDDVDKASRKPEEIRKCLHAGKLPDCYQDTAVSIEVQSLSTISCFTKVDDNTVLCPTGQILKKTKMRGQNSIFANKDACRQCKTRCTNSTVHKTVSFGPDTDCVPVRMYGDSSKVQPIPKHAMISPYNHTLDRTDYADQKKVVVRIKENKEKLKLRMCLSEHPFGTVKWYDGAHYLLCRGIEKVSGEISLSFLAYNLRRAINLVGVPALIQAARG